jgi:hypothetical protein
MPGYNLLSENEKKVFITRTLRWKKHTDLR